MSEQKEVIDAEVLEQPDETHDTSEPKTKKPKSSGNGVLWLLWLLSTAALALAVTNLYLGQPWFTLGHTGQTSAQANQSDAAADLEQKFAQLTANLDNKLAEKIEAKLSQQHAEKPAEKPAEKDTAATQPETSVAATPVQQADVGASAEQSQASEAVATQQQAMADLNARVAQIQQALQTQRTDQEDKIASVNASLTQLQTVAQERAKQDANLMTQLQPVIADALRFATLQKQPQTAGKMLQHAATVLHTSADPAYLHQQQQLTQAAKDLLALPTVDVAGISSQIDALSAAVPTLVLPENSIKPNQNTSAEGWQHVAENVWSDIKSLVKVRQEDVQGVGRLLSPEAKSLAYNVTQLYLQRLQLATLSQQQSLFDNAAQATENWVKQVFVGEHEATQKFLQALSKISSQKVAPSALPGSIKAVKGMVTHD